MSAGWQDSAERIAALLERLMTPMVERAEGEEKRRRDLEAIADATGETAAPIIPFRFGRLVSDIRHVVILSGQITVVKDNGECWTLGREGSMPTGPLEWQQLPPIPGTAVWEAKRNADQ